LDTKSDYVIAREECNFIEMCKGLDPYIDEQYKHYRSQLLVNITLVIFLPESLRRQWCSCRMVLRHTYGPAHLTTSPPYQQKNACAVHHQSDSPISCVSSTTKTEKM
jgi:hypothetical protein